MSDRTGRGDQQKSTHKIVVIEEKIRLVLTCHFQLIACHLHLNFYRLSSFTICRTIETIPVYSHVHVPHSHSSRVLFNFPGIFLEWSTY